MLKKLLTLVAMLFAVASFAAVDVNTANEAELDGVKGIGPGLSGKILAERKNGEFKDWDDFIGRVSGVGTNSAARFSQEGLTVSGKTFSAAPAAKAEIRSKKHGSTVSPHKPEPGVTTDAGGSPVMPITAPPPVGKTGASKN